MSTEAELIGKLPTTKGEAKRELLLSLCEFRSAAADVFWEQRLKRPLNGYLPYLCYSRSDAVSDYAADALEHIVNKMVITRNQFSAELTEDAWRALNLCVFKESPRMFEVLRKIGKYAEILRSMELDMHALLYSETLPPFLRRQANLAYAHRCETNFLRLLNDLLICTYVRSGEAFHAALLSLVEAYPDTFGYAGFFAAFVTDQSAAFKQYGTPTRFDQVIGTLTGLDYNENTGNCSQYSPLWFYGVKNRIWHKKYDIPVPDDRWISWLCRAYCFADEGQRRKLSALLFRFTWMEEMHEQLREYFFHAALEDTSECNLIGMMRCGGYPMTEALIQGICEKICKGRNHYHALFAVFDLLDLKKAEKLRLLSEARAFIESSDHRESWYAQRNHFLHAVKLYQTGKRSEFD